MGDSKLTDVVSEKEINEKVKEALRKLNERNDETYEKMNSFHTGLADLNIKTENMGSLKTKFDQLSSELHSHKIDIGSQVKDSYEKIQSDYESVATDVKHMKKSLVNNSQA